MNELTHDTKVVAFLFLFIAALWVWKQYLMHLLNVLMFTKTAKKILYVLCLVGLYVMMRKGF